MRLELDIDERSSQFTLGNFDSSQMASQKTSKAKRLERSRRFRFLGTRDGNLADLTFTASSKLQEFSEAAPQPDRYTC